jgi:hypothetical protein
VEKSGGMRKERGRQLYQKKGLHFGKMDVQHPHFLNLAPTLGRAKSSIPHGTWRFHEKVKSPKIPQELLV